MHEYDLICIGSGPHALRALATLAIGNRGTLADWELRRLETFRRRFASGASGPGVLDNTVVVDTSGAFMGTWMPMFAAQQIPFLRSPATAHPEPTDEAALLDFAFRQGTLDRGGFIDPMNVRFGSSNTDFNAGVVNEVKLPESGLFARFCEVRPARSRPDRQRGPH